jgi:hypothetical protein
MIVNTTSERWMTAPRPRATATAWTLLPSSLPSTVAQAARRPRATPRVTTKSTLGPGMTSSAMAAAANPNTWVTVSTARR